jgi:isocitrate/isopropylmalate dehydrogenase
MRNLYAILLLLSLVCNAYLLSMCSDPKPSNAHKVIVKENKEGLYIKNTSVSEDTTMFVVDFMSRINECDTFLWAVSENKKEIKYTIWFAKEQE